MAVSTPPGPPCRWFGLPEIRAMARDYLGFLREQQRQYGDLVALKIFGIRSFLLFHPEHAREALVNSHESLIRFERGTRIFSDAHGQSVLVAEGEPWKAKRRALQPGFSPRRVEAFAPLMVAAFDDAMRGWPQAANFELDFEQAMTQATMDVIMRTLFSSSAQADARAAEVAVHDLSQEGNREMFWPRTSPLWMPWKARKRRAIQVLDRLIRRHIAARGEREDGDDLLAMLMQLRTEQGTRAFAGEALRDECMTIFLAGHETSATALTWWGWAMAAHPEIAERAAAEVAAQLGPRAPGFADIAALPYLTQTIKESLRRHPPVPALLSRRATRDFTLGGTAIPRGAMLQITPGLMQNDARWFPEPDAFRPERFAADAPEIPRGAWMPFGAGPRVCLGSHFALTEITLIAAMLLQRFSFAPAPGSQPPEPVLNITLRPRERLRLVLARR
jgi:cytochrome P450